LLLLSELILVVILFVLINF